MRPRTTVSIGLLSASLLFSTGCAEPPPEETEEVAVESFSAEDEAAVRANLDTFMQTDPIDAPDTFYGQFSEDVYWVYDAETPWEGIQGLRNVDWCHTLSAEINADRVEGEGDLAYARGTYSLSLDCDGEEPEDSEGVFLSVHRRQENGSWRIESLLQRD